ncbi:MAG: hypothetical protein C0617_14940 [Desulfuromonas sp.]|nr:MAG: hypothetical protein C0617_14940 [Desulfuromonas sp.]
MVAALLLAGCANHLPEETVASHKVNRVPVSRQLNLSLDQGQVLSRDMLRVKATETNTIQIQELTNTQVYEAFTPYQVLREVYELPFGVISIVGGVVINVVDVALLGLLPNSFTDGALSAGFAGINPFLNIESASRKKLELASQMEEVQDQRIESIETALAGQPLQVTSMGVPHRVELNERGEANICLFDLFDVLPLSRELVFSVEVDDARAEEATTVSRQLTASIYQAQKILARHGREGGEREEIGVTEAARDILALSGLGFEHASQSLEEQLMRGMTPARQQQLMGALIEPAELDRIAPSPAAATAVAEASGEIEVEPGSAVPAASEPVPERTGPEAVDAEQGLGEEAGASAEASGGTADSTL